MHQLGRQGWKYFAIVLYVFTYRTGVDLATKKEKKNKGIHSGAG